MKPNYQEHVELTFVEVENLMESTTPPLSAQKWYYTYIYIYILDHKAIYKQMLVSAYLKIPRC